MGTYSLNASFTDTSVISDEYVADYSGVASSGSFYFGTYMVRSSVVPVPPALWLFGSALGLLGWMRRKAANRFQ